MRLDNFEYRGKRRKNPKAKKPPTAKPKAKSSRQTEPDGERL